MTDVYIQFCACFELKNKTELEWWPKNVEQIEYCRKHPVPPVPGTYGFAAPKTQKFENPDRVTIGVANQLRKVPGVTVVVPGEDEPSE